MDFAYFNLKIVHTSVNLLWFKSLTGKFGAITYFLVGPPPDGQLPATLGAHGGGHLHAPHCVQSVSVGGRGLGLLRGPSRQGRTGQGPPQHHANQDRPLKRQVCHGLAQPKGSWCADGRLGLTLGSHLYRWGNGERPAAAPQGGQNVPSELILRLFGWKIPLPRDRQKSERNAWPFSLTL